MTGAGPVRIDQTFKPQARSMSALQHKLPVTLFIVVNVIAATQSIAQGLPGVFVVSSNAINQLRDTNDDGDFFDSFEMTVYADMFPAVVCALTLNHDSLFAVSDNRIYSIRDLNADGDALDANEVAIFAEPALGLLNPDFVAIEWAEPFGLLLLDAGNGMLLRVSDQNNDNDALDRNEVITIATGLTLPTDVTFLADGRVLVAEDLAATPVRVLEDRNQDGDYFDFAENISYVENQPVGASLVALNQAQQYHLRPMISDVVTYLDSNADGDALDANEVLMYASGLDQPACMALAASSQTLFVSLNNLNRDLLALRDLNNDGDALDANEQIVVATQLGSISAIAAIEPITDCLLGDADGNGTVAIADLSIFSRVLVGASAPAPVCSLDMNNDGNLDGRDVQPFIAALIGP